MIAYYQEVRKLEDKFQGIELHHIPRRDNDAADFLAKLATRRDPSPSGVFINDIHEPSARILEGLTQTHPDAQPTLGGSDPSTSTSPANVAVLALDQTDWRVPLLAYLLEEVLPPERTEARRIARRTKTFIVLGNELYKRSPSGVLMKVRPRQPGKTDPPRGPFRDLWVSCGPKIPGRKNLLLRFLLAHRTTRCRGGHPQV